MKKIVLLLLITNSLTVKAQDSAVYKPDSVNVISVNDIKEALKFTEDKLLKKDYDYYLAAYQFLLQYVDKKRRKVKK